MDIETLRLKKNEDRRLRAGHLWVYSNQVDTEKTPLSSFQPGQPVRIAASNGSALGTGYVNPHSLICARLVSRDPSRAFDRSLLVHRLNVALALRTKLYREPYYRLVFGESDGLPGLIVDRFGDTVVVQITTAGMEARLEAVLEALSKVLSARTVILRNDTAVRELEGLSRYVECVHGEAPEFLALTENGTEFHVPIAGGQKTGWFYDQRDNRTRLRTLTASARVLDVFSYVGAWGIQAACAQAREVFCIDSSQSALDMLTGNAAHNGVGHLVSALKGDAFEVMAQLRRERERFDVVVVDPPAFIKRKKDATQGMRAYRRLNQMAMQLLSRDGLLVSASCSFHLSRMQLQSILQQATRHLDRSAQILLHGYQAPDHPIHPAIAETEYLKVIFSRVLPS